jgi:CheY-like chemotaxis protein
VTNETVLCDKLHLNQILLNILGNAVKFTPDGGEISVQLKQLLQKGKDGQAGYRFCIRDNGIGMSEEFQKHLFEQFSRENSSTVSGIPGTGLGMAITKSIVDRMGGTISVKSRLGEGTEFVIDLKLPVYTSAPSESERQEAEAPGIKKSLRLLLVEDNALNQEIAAEMLSDCGFTVAIANNGKEALDMIKNAEPDDYDAVLMDIQMPVMNGYEATEKIRRLKDKRLSGIPIIAMTANAFEEDRKKALNAGMNDFVTKPIDIDKLLGALSSLTEVCA